MNLSHDTPPASDLLLCRDCLNHLSLDEAVDALNNILASGARYLAVTQFPATRVNGDQESGFIYRPLNLLRPPFNLPRPMEVWEEPTEPGKALAVWRLPLTGRALDDSKNVRLTDRWNT